MPEVPATNQDVTTHLAPERLRELLEPGDYAKLAGALIDRVLAESEDKE